MGKLQVKVTRTDMDTLNYVVKRLLLIVALCFIYPVMTHCQDRVVEVTIDEHDKKEIITRLEELKVRREQAKMFQTIIDRDSQQDQRDRELCNREVTILGQERDEWKGKAETWKTAYEDAMKGRSAKCWVLKVCTIGLARCK